MPPIKAAQEKQPGEGEAKKGNSYVRKKSTIAVRGRIRRLNGKGVKKTASLGF